MEKICFEPGSGWGKLRGGSGALFFGDGIDYRWWWWGLPIVVVVKYSSET